LTEATLHLHGARIFKVTAGARGEACRHEERQAEMHWDIHGSSSLGIVLTWLVVDSLEGLLSREHRVPPTKRWHPRDLLIGRHQAVKSSLGIRH
jgi:hypothetical protein